MADWKPLKPRKSKNAKQLLQFVYRVVCCSLRHRASAIVWRLRADGECEVLLVSSSRDSNKFTLPGGGVEKGETSAIAAAREVMEEAGVSGELDSQLLGTVKDNKKRSRTDVFAMRLTHEHSNWLEAKLGRIRQWIPLHEADSKLSRKPAAQQMLRLFWKARPDLRSKRD